jgi:protein-lysine N-methyltransferase EEF2KMT
METYDPTLFPALISTFRLLLALNPLLEILIAATVRNEHTFARFVSACGAYSRFETA